MKRNSENKHLKKKIFQYYAIFILAILDVEIFFCNASFVSGFLRKTFVPYTFSLARIFLYIVLFALYCLLRKKIISNRMTYDSKEHPKFLNYIIICLISIIVIITLGLTLINRMTIIGLSICCLISIYLIFLLFFHSDNFKLNVFLTCFISLIFCITTDAIHPIDEMIHFTTAYNRAHGNFGDKISYSNSSLDAIPGWANFNSLSSLQVHYDKTPYLVEKKTERWPSSGSSIPYIPQTIGIFVSEVFNGTIMDTFYFGRIFNSLFFLFGVYFLMKVAKNKINCICVVLLTPFLLLLSGTYNVDAFGIITVLLFSSYLLSIVLDKEKLKLSSKDFIILIGLSFLILSFKSASYCFIFCLYFLLLKKIPKKQKMVIILIFILLMCIALKLMIPSDSNSGDSRGGDTSFIRQLNFLFSSPIVFIKVYLLHTLNTFLSINFYQELNSTTFFGNYSAYLTIIYLVYLLLVGLSDDDEKVRFNVIEKVIIFITVCLLFYFTSTTMYLAFTPVGEVIIKGYQSRYIFPFLALILMLCNNNFIKVKLGKNYYLKLYTMSLAILLLYTYCAVFSRIIKYFM